MPDPWLLLGALTVGAFLLSGVIPAYLRCLGRIRRTDRFAARYRDWVESDWPDGEDRDWLIARGPEMQADAQHVGQGVMYVAPPLGVGGGPHRPHFMFSDLAGATTFGVGTSERLDALTMAEHQLRVQANHRRGDLTKPWRWLQLAFERLVRFPHYLLKTAGFSDSVAGSTVARGFGLLWSLLVGLATIGAFALALVDRA